MALQTFDTPSDTPDVSLFNTAELLRARAQIQQHLCGFDLGTMNLAQELVLQYSMVQQLITETVNDDTIPLNQRAQAVNSGTQLLIQLGKLQTDVYNASRVQRIEGAVIATFERLGEDYKATFMQLLRDSLGE